MKLVKLCAMAFALASCAAGAAQAQNWYASGSAGLVRLDKTDDTSVTPSETAKFGTGYALQGAIGYSFDSGLRTELEVSYLDSDIKNVTTAGTTTAVLGGDVDVFAGHAAAYYDFAVGSFAPYLGGGLGVANVDIDPGTIGGVAIPTSNETNFSMFGELGVSIPVSEGVAIAPAVRYLWVDTGSNGIENTTGWMFKTAVRFAF